jgi:hypothetical protein
MSSTIWRWVVLVALVAYWVLPDSVPSAWHGLVDLVIVINAGMLIWDGFRWLRRQLRLAESIEIIIEVHRRRNRDASGRPIELGAQDD